MHDAERVLKPRVHGAGIDLVGPGKLANPPQALKRRVRENLPFPIVESDEAMDGAADLEYAVWVHHSPTPNPAVYLIGEQKGKP
jgi:hypothetical protein